MGIIFLYDYGQYTTTKKGWHFASLSIFIVYGLFMIEQIKYAQLKTPVGRFYRTVFIDIT